ncbi:MAG: hypothetical protein K2Q34_07905 [Alphaproteobacteria bacterium]|nr:hypothetical protein [Alphaproteobacteria bacterium]
MIRDLPKNILGVFFLIAFFSVKLFASDPSSGIPNSEELMRYKSSMPISILLLGTEPEHLEHFDLSSFGHEVGVFFHSTYFYAKRDPKNCVDFNFTKDSDLDKYSKFFSGSFEAIIPDNYVTHHAPFTVKFFQSLILMLQVGGKLYLGGDGITASHTQLGPFDYSFRDCAPESEGTVIDTNKKPTRVYKLEKGGFSNHTTTLETVLNGGEYNIRGQFGKHGEAPLVTRLMPKIKCHFENPCSSEEVPHQLDEAYRNYVIKWWSENGLIENSSIEVKYGIFPYRTTEKYKENDSPCWYFEVTRTN